MKKYFTCFLLLCTTLNLCGLNIFATVPNPAVPHVNSHLQLTDTLKKTRLNISALISKMHHSWIGR